MFDTKPHEQNMNLAFEHFEGELRKVSTGRARPDMLDGVMVGAYGSRMPLNQVANVTAPEPQMILITPFDPTNIVAISAAIRENQTMGFNPSDDGRVVRVPVPALTEERRKLLVKQVGEKVEDARIAIRNIRQDALKEAKKMRDDKQIGEDDYKRIEKEVDELTGRFQAKIDESFKAKEKDVLTI